ncbi:hypothetical protein C8D88_101241 [Lentzea atacamensis]|uniref:Uncharacterized protein n=1 Tax=Lentzea atacamensis TaxID=531938 RepID=A0A316IB54_9PSEU|nr:hypothetical protein [Lentzea atacamensis]PWK90229.1 hypothetical protein C8D88_101241 [Lentzea atacamensis]
MKVETRTRYSALRGLAVPLMVVAATLAGQGQAVAAAEPLGPLIPAPVPLHLSNPEAYALAKDAGDALRYSLAAVADDLDRSYAAGTVEADLKQGLLSLPVAKRNKFVAAAKEAVKVSPNNLTAAMNPASPWGRHGRLTATQFRAIGFKGAFDTVQIDAAKLKAAVNKRAQALKQEEKEAETEAEKAARRLGLDLSTQPKLTALDFRIQQVKAVEETSGWGSDEILLGGMETFHTGYTRKIKPWKVSDDFDAGEVVNYPAPGHKFGLFGMPKADPWPRSFVSVVMMAEEDSGGFADAVNQAWLKVRDDISEKIKEAVGEWASEYVGAAIGEMLGKVIGFLVGDAVEFIANWFKDDLFDAHATAVHLPSPYAFMYNNPADAGWTNHQLPTTKMRFTGHGGDYRVEGRWTVYG